jgi:plastocyanin
MNFVPAQVATIQVIIGKIIFSPAEINARAGDMVTSINKDIVAHTATVHGGFDVAIEMNTSASLVLTKAGIVEYYCRFHPNMKERITITQPYGVREYFYSCPFPRSEKCRLV